MFAVPCSSCSSSLFLLVSRSSPCGWALDSCWFVSPVDCWKDHAALQSAWPTGPKNRARRPNKSQGIGISPTNLQQLTRDEEIQNDNTLSRQHIGVTDSAIAPSARMTTRGLRNASLFFLHLFVTSALTRATVHSLTSWTPDTAHWHLLAAARKLTAS